MGRRARSLQWLTILAVALFGVTNLPRPLAGDQALFLTTARAMQHGAVLYRDVWDVKQPGIYAFYWLSGRAFGFDEIGVHLGELVVLLVFTVVLQRTLPDLGFSRRTAALAPLVVVLPYVVLSTTWDLTQLEPLIGLPLYVALWASVRAAEASDATSMLRWQAVAGAAVAVVSAFKLLYAPIGVVFLVRSLRRANAGRAIAAWCAGAAIVAAPVLAWAASYRLLGELWYTTVRFPRTARKEAAQPLSTLTSNARSFARTILPVALPAAFGWWVQRRATARTTGTVATARTATWVSLATWWIVVGLLLDLTQFWWRYLYWNVSVPLGLFALVGLERLAVAVRADRRIAAATALGAAVLVGLAIAPTAGRFGPTLAIPFDADARPELHRKEQDLYGDLDETIAVLRSPDALAGPVLVFGSPIVQLAADRPQAGRIAGYLANTLGPREWHEMADDVRHDPPAYVFIGSVQEHDEQELLDTRGTEVRAILDADYCPAAAVPAGRWLVRCAG